jgi:riboflavin biosynthesis pyrimidine reductase
MHRLSASGPEPSDEVLAQWYAYDSGVRSNMVMTADGSAIGSDGLSGQLSGTADRRLLSVLRGVADAVIVAAGTIRAEGYAPIRTRDSLQGYRKSAGLAEHPVLVVITSTPTLDPGLSMFTDAPVLPVVVCARDNGTLAGAAHVIEVPDAGGRVDLGAAVAALQERGHVRLHCEGGPSLLGGFLTAGLLDEYCVTISPNVLSGTGKRPATGPSAPTGFELVHTLVDGDFLFLRYRRTAS